MRDVLITVSRQGDISREWLKWQRSACNSGDLGSIPGLGRSPGEGNDNPLQYSFLEDLHGQRSLVGYSPGGHKELDTTKATKPSTAHGVL